MPRGLRRWNRSGISAPPEPRLGQTMAEPGAPGKRMRSMPMASRVGPSKAEKAGPPRKTRSAEALKTAATMPRADDTRTKASSCRGVGVRSAICRNSLIDNLALWRMGRVIRAIALHLENSARLGKRHRSSPRPGAIGLYYFCHAKICFQSFFMLITVQPLALASSYRD